MNTSPHYNNWIRKKRILLFWTLSAILLASAALGLVAWPLYALGLLALPLLYIASVITYMWWQFGPRGGDYIGKIHQLIIDSVRPSGSVLDIGCGSGQLLITLAKQNGSGSYTGIDYWGKDWDYSRRQCEENARIEGVSGITFQNASASQLPFADGSFNTIVSCVTFHEVQDTDDKTKSITEALRVLKPDGTFSFVDLFDSPTHFGGRERVIQAITAAGGTITSQRKLSTIMPLPRLLDTGKALKYAVLITGNK